MTRNRITSEFQDNTSSRPQSRQIFTPKLLPLMTLLMLIGFLTALPLVAQGAPPEGKGNGQGNGPQNVDHGNRGHGKGQANRNGARNSNRIASARNNIHKLEANRQRQFKAHPGQSENRDNENSLRHLEVNPDYRGKRFRDHQEDHFNRLIVREFEATIRGLRSQGKGPWGNPRVDGLPRENHSPHDMLDPYGLSKDDRKEETGNRGRIIREVDEPPQEPPPPEPVYVNVTNETFTIIQNMDWNGETVTRQMLSDAGYSGTEIDFLLSISLSDILLAVQGDGMILIP